MPAPDNLTIQTPGEPITQPAAEQPTTSTEQQATLLYTAKSNGGGRFKVWYTPADPSEQAGWYSDFVATGEGAKDAAQAEADRLNAGGQPYVKPADPEPEPNVQVQQQAQPAARKAATPRTQAILTDEGWLVSELPANYAKE